MRKFNVLLKNYWSLMLIYMYLLRDILLYTYLCRVFRRDSTEGTGKKYWRCWNVLQKSCNVWRLNLIYRFTETKNQKLWYQYYHNNIQYDYYDMMLPRILSIFNWSIPMFIICVLIERFCFFLFKSRVNCITSLR